jgi:hypothetical protein
MGGVPRELGDSSAGARNLKWALECHRWARRPHVGAEVRGQPGSFGCWVGGLGAILAVAEARALLPAGFFLGAALRVVACLIVCFPGTFPLPSRFYLQSEIREKGL